MAFQISCDVFIWLWYNKPLPSSPPQSLPSPHHDPLTPANLGLPCVFKCSHEPETVTDREPVCARVSVYLCVAVLVTHHGWDHLRGGPHERGT